MEQSAKNPPSSHGPLTAAWMALEAAGVFTAMALQSKHCLWFLIPAAVVFLVDIAVAQTRTNR